MACYGFDGADDGVAIALGGMAPVGAHTFAALIYRGASNVWHNVLAIQNGSGTGIWSAEVADDSAGFVNQFGEYGDSGLYGVGAGAVAASAWTIVACTKATGSSIPRLHRCQSGGAWTHANATNGAFSISSGASAAKFGLYPGNIDDFNGRMVVACWWNSVLSDAQLEALSFTSFTAWRDHAVSPNNCWKFRWEDGNLVDVIGTADETSRTGTATATEPPSWDWGTGAQQYTDTGTVSLKYTPSGTDVYESNTQKIYPTNDISLGSWTPTPSTPTTLYDKIDETTLDTADYITSDAAASSGSGEITIRVVSALLYDTDKTDHTLTLNDNIAPGELVIIINGGTAPYAAGYDNHFTSIDTAGGGTWYRDLYEPGGSGGDYKASSIWSCYMPDGMSSGGTISCHGTHSSPTYQAYAINGLGSVPGQNDRLAGASTVQRSYTDTPPSNSITPSANGCIILGYIHDGGNLTDGAFWTPGGSWNEISDMADASPGGTGSGSTHAVQYIIQDTAASIQSTGTSRTATSWTHGIVAYKRAGA